jgi:hypothetical protein
MLGLHMIPTPWLLNGMKRGFGLDLPGQGADRPDLVRTTDEQLPPATTRTAARGC